MTGPSTFYWIRVLPTVGPVTLSRPDPTTVPLRYESSDLSTETTLRNLRWDHFGRRRTPSRPLPSYRTFYEKEEDKNKEDRGRTVTGPCTTPYFSSEQVSRSTFVAPVEKLVVRVGWWKSRSAAEDDVCVWSPPYVLQDGHPSHLLSD